MSVKMTLVMHPESQEKQSHVALSWFWPKKRQKHLSPIGKVKIDKKGSQMAKGII